MKDELDRLLAGLCDGILTDSEHVVLGERIAADAAARGRYVEYLDLHAALAGPAGMALPDFAEQAKPLRSTRRFWTRFALAYAAAVLVGAVAWLGIEASRGPVIVCPAPMMMSELRLVEFGGRAEVADDAGRLADAHEGNPVKPGETLRTGAGDGYAVLDFGRGSWLQLSPDAQMRFAEGGIAGAIKVILVSGILRGEVKKTDDLTVVTPGGEFHPNGARFLISANAPNVMETEAEAVSPLKPLATFESFAYWGLGFTDETRLVTRLKSSQYAVLNVDSQTMSPLRPEAPQDSAAAGLSGDGSRYFTVQKAGLVKVWNTGDCSRQAAFPVGEAARWTWTISPDGSTLAALHHVSGPPIEVRFWDATTGRELPAGKPALTPRCVALSADGRYAAWAIDGRKKQPHSLEVWDVAAAKRVSNAEVLDSPLRVLSFSPDGSLLAGGTEAGVVHVFESATGRVRNTLLPVGSSLRPVSVLAYSRSGSMLAAGRADGRVEVWNAESGTERMALQPGSRSVTALAFSPSGRSIAVGQLRQPTTVWAVSHDRD